VGLKHNSTLYADAFLPNVQIGLRGKDEEDVVPGPHTWDGSYTELRFTWRGHEVLLQTAHDGEDLVMLATPGAPKTSVLPSLIISAGILWNRPGGAAKSGDHIEFTNGSRRIPVYWTGAEQAPVSIALATPYFAAQFQKPIGVSTGRPRTVGQIRAVLDRQRPPSTGVPRAVETVMGWDTIYDPSQARVISPVSRLWSTGWGGYVLFEWDTFFAATLAAVGDRDLAYANAIEILREATPAGLVPNYARPGGWKSFDRSESPVGAVTVLNIYRRFHDAWFLRIRSSRSSGGTAGGMSIASSTGILSSAPTRTTGPSIPTTPRSGPCKARSMRDSTTAPCTTTPRSMPTRTGCTLLTSGSWACTSPTAGRWPRSRTSSEGTLRPGNCGPAASASPPGSRPSGMGRRGCSSTGTSTRESLARDVAHELLPDGGRGRDPGRPSAW